MVAGGEGDDAAGALGRRELGQAGERPARLEGAGALEELALEEEPAAQPLVELARGDDRCAVDAARDALARGAHVVERDRGSGQGAHSAPPGQRAPIIPAWLEPGWSEALLHLL